MSNQTIIQQTVETVVVVKELESSVLELFSVGPQGPSGSLTIGTVTTLGPDEPATIVNVGTPAHAVLNIGLPKGDIGDITPELEDLLVAATAQANQAQTSAESAVTKATEASVSASNAAASAATAETQASVAATKASESEAASVSATGSAATATTKASEAVSAAATATTQATAATGSATAAQTSATSAASSATGATASKDAAAVSATTASTKASEASASATSAQTSATTATTQAGVATTKAAEAVISATNAAGSATAASGSASVASTQAANAEASATAAQTSATNAAASEASVEADAATATSQAGIASTKATEAAVSASTASTQAGVATTKATEAAASATTASTQASIATTKATEASSSASASLASETAAATSASSAATSATNAAASESLVAANAATATTQASIATTKAGEASTSATAASTAATTAITQAGNAEASAIAAATAKNAAETARDQALSAFDSFDDRMLGQFATDPTVDNDGDPLQGGALYFNTNPLASGGGMKVYDAINGVWLVAYSSLSGALLSANNLSDLASASAARINLGLSNVENKSAATILAELSGAQVETSLGFTPVNAAALAGVATSGAYSDLTGKPSLFSGAYADLSGKPTAVSAFTNDAGYLTGINSSQITAALGFTPYSSSNPDSYITAAALAGYLTAETAASTYQTALVSGTSIKTVNGQSVLGSGNIQIDGGVTSFNTRTGAVTLGSSDVTGALGFTPYNASNPSGYITSSGSITGNAGTATTLQTARTINGVSFNGSANITVADGTKLPLAGGTMTGAISFAAGQTWPTFNQNTTGTAANVTGTVAIANGGTGATTAAGALTALGAYAASNPAGYITASADITGNAATATILATARTINGVSFNGSANITIADNTKLPLAGGVLTGQLEVGGNLFLSGNSGGIRTFGMPGSSNTTLVIQGGAVSGSGANIELTSDNFCYIDATVTRIRSQNALTSFLDISASATNVVTGALQQGGNQVLHAGNYTSYSPSLTGSGASGTWGISITGNAATASALATARTIALTGDVTGSASFDGSGNISISTTSAGGGGVTLTGVETLTNKTVERLILNDGYTEEVFTITDGTTVNLDPNNGSIQTWTLGANRTPGQANWAAGQSITLMIDDGTARTITWSTLAVVWETNGGTAPTLALTGFTVIVLWKVGSTIYGARVGDA